jgi:dTDP-3,4-didehydro-2,6-dideoxy-alpha-D-glucose 3-reductase
MTAPVRFGVLGCAEIARRKVLPALSSLPGAGIAAVAGRDAGRAAEVARRHGCAAVHGYARLLERDDVDAVYVPLPAALHAEWVEAALLAGKHVLAEKPLTTDPAATARLLALARERGLALMENVMFVHHRQHARVRELVADGAIGELRALHASFTIPAPPAGDIRHRADLGGGALLDIGLYPVRAALHLLGPGLRVAGAVLTTPPGHEVETSGGALLHTPDGVAAHLAFGMDHAYESRVTLHGSLGRLTVGRAFTPPPDHAPVLRLERARGTEEIRLPPDDQVAATLTAFTAAVRSGHAPQDDCLRQAELLAEVRDAAVRGAAAWNGTP